MYSKRARLLTLLLALLPLVASLAVWPDLPERMASHWNTVGAVNGTMGRARTAFFIPILTLAIWGLFAALPRVAPSLAGPQLGRAKVHGFIAVLIGFFDMIHFQVLAWNLGHHLDFGFTVPVGLGVVFIFIGRVLGSVEPNWAVGIRTYWTLKSPVVWARTHERAEILFKVLGGIYVAAVFLRNYLLFVILLPAVFVALYLPAYSFMLYQKIQQSGDDEIL